MSSLGHGFGCVLFAFAALGAPNHAAADAVENVPAPNDSARVELPALNGTSAEAGRAFLAALELHRQARGALPIPSERQGDPQLLRAAIQARLDRFGDAGMAYKRAAKAHSELQVAGWCGQGLVREDLADFLGAQPSPEGLSEAETQAYRKVIVRQQIQLRRGALAFYAKAESGPAAEVWTRFAQERALALNASIELGEGKLN